MRQNLTPLCIHIGLLSHSLRPNGLRKLRDGLSSRWPVRTAGTVGYRWSRRLRATTAIGVFKITCHSYRLFRRQPRQLRKRPTQMDRRSTRTLSRRAHHPSRIEKGSQRRPHGDRGDAKKSLKFVTPREGSEMAQNCGARKYLECSSLTGEGVDDVFEAATRAALLTFNDKRNGGGCCTIL